MRPGRQKQGGGQEGGQRRATPRVGTRPSEPPCTSRHRLCAGPRRPRVGGRVRPSEEHPSHARPPWGQSLQHQDSRVGLHPNPKAALAVSPSHPRPSHLGHLLSSCPRRPWGPPAHICRAPWPSQRPGSPCPESPSFLSQSSHDPQQPRPRREQRQRTGGAAQGPAAGHGAGSACTRPTPPRAIGAAASCRPPRIASISSKQPPRSCP